MEETQELTHKSMCLHALSENPQPRWIFREYQIDGLQHPFHFRSWWFREQDEIDWEVWSYDSDRIVCEGTRTGSIIDLSEVLDRIDAAIARDGVDYYKPKEHPPHLDSEKAVLPW